MPDPSKIFIGDYIKYIARPYEWNKKNYRVVESDIEFIDELIRRKRWQRICSIDEYGNRWINVVLSKNGKREYHSWAIFENSGWIIKNAQKAM